MIGKNMKYLEIHLLSSDGAFVLNLDLDFSRAYSKENNSPSNREKTYIVLNTRRIICIKV